MYDSEQVQDPGHQASDTHSNRARAASQDASRSPQDTQTDSARAPIEDLCEDIRILHRMRVDIHNAEKRLILQCKSICRRLCDGDKTEGSKLYVALEKGGDHELLLEGAGALMDLLPHIKEIRKSRKKYEREMTKAAKKLPVWEWVEGVNGAGAMGLAQIVGEAGDLGKYANPGKLWKRMGLAVINGGRQRRVTGDAALEHGYSAVRRAVIYCIGDSMIKKQSEYRELYLWHKCKDENERPDIETPGHRHNRAQRYMEKRFLKNLWQEWRKRSRAEDAMRPAGRSLGSAESPD